MLPNTVGSGGIPPGTRFAPRRAEIGHDRRRCEFWRQRLGLALIVVGCGHQARSAPLTNTPEQAVADVVKRVAAAPVDPDPRVGAFFLSDSDVHACTGSVLHSAAGNLVLTAAHCLSAGGPARFVPGFGRTAAPDEMWTVDALYLDPRWLANKDPHGRLCDRAGQPVGRRSGGGGGRLRVVTGCRAGARQPSDGGRLSRGCRRVADRMPNRHRAQRRADTPNCPAQAWSTAPAARPGSAARQSPG